MRTIRRKTGTLKRTRLVIAGAVVGLLGVLALPLSTRTPMVATLPTRSGTTSTTSAGTGTGGSGATTQTTLGTRSATGSTVNFNYGTLAVTVTAAGSTVTDVKVSSLNDGGNGYSQYVDSQSIPQLEQQALAAQSANIQGVSGASYTSSGFQQSLQSALTQLGL